MDGHSIILAIKAGANIMTFGVMPLTVIMLGVFAYAFIQEFKSNKQKTTELQNV